MIKKLKDLGFKKIPGTEPGFHMYELTPAKLQSFDENFKPQAASEPRTEKRASLQARKRTSLTSKQIWDIVGYMKEKYKYKYIVCTGGVDDYFTNYKQAKKVYNEWIDLGYNDVQIEKSDKIVKEIYESNRIR